ncbi:hypothetical protein SDC9_88862 [bioreactor metagenome]|uniref:MobA-like NTP transferase domain-containing protein n=1 Tax=bioreactor metagenome TaxID=1076179 RepID=A0A644ZMN1_9ZZZZ|nr:hypothetical protein [Candidatus Metalachnospira sp.]
MSAKNTAGIIIATGYDSLGRQMNPLTPLGTTTIVKRIVLTYQLAGISPIIVITGFDGLSVERHLANYGVVFFRVENYSEIDFKTDILPALTYAAEKCSQIMVSPVEYPLFWTSTIKKIIQNDGQIRVPINDERLGYPFLLSADVLPELDTEKKFEGWMSFLNECGLDIRLIPVSDEGVACSIENIDHCNNILEQHNRQMLHPYVRLDIDYVTRIFDPKMKMLLMQIEDTKSVKTACSRISLSIGKAWEIINVLEDALGYQVVSRRQGGKKGGSTELTAEGEEYLEKYRLLEKKIQNYANEEFTKIFLTDVE